MAFSRRISSISNHLSPHTHHSNVIQPSEVCGIIGYVGSGNASSYILDGLRILENRGYDSAGITTISPEKKLLSTKFASNDTTSDAMNKLAQVVPSHHQGHSIGIGHTRWATHGGKTDVNAHPHHDSYDRIAVVHNGVIENYSELKEELTAKGVSFVSETDTEVIAQLIGQFVREGEAILEAVKKAQRKLQGTYGLAVLDREEPNTIIAAKNGSPMLVGIGQGRMFVASESSAFAQHTKEFIALEDGEIAVVTSEDCSLDVSRVELAPDEVFHKTPAPYEHWTIKEILEQPLAISNALNFGGRIIGDYDAKLGGLDANQNRMLSIQNLVISACGTSFFASLYGQKLMNYLASFNSVNVVDASEFNHDSIPHRDAGMLVLSQSGETKDVHRALMLAEETGIPTFSIVNVVRSLIARTTNCGVYLNAGRENAVASTKSFTCQVTVLALVSVWFSARRNHREESRKERRRQVVEALHRLSTNIGMTTHRVRAQCKQVAERMKESRHCFILGKGFAEPVAREGALKIKEITYVHAEGYPGGALKHGPFALIEPGTPIILIVLADQHRNLMKTALEEVKLRGAYTIAITNDPTLSIADENILIPSNGPLTALLSVIPLQLIAYELSVKRGIDPDHPRHLAKVVTVD